jgi:hypothetical protein
MMKKSMKKEIIEEPLIDIEDFWSNKTLKSLSETRGFFIIFG